MEDDYWLINYFDHFLFRSQNKLFYPSEINGNVRITFAYKNDLFSFLNYV